MANLDPAKVSQKAPLLIPFSCTDQTSSISQRKYKKIKRKVKFSAKIQWLPNREVAKNLGKIEGKQLLKVRFSQIKKEEYPSKMYPYKFVENPEKKHKN